LRERETVAREKEYRFVRVPEIPRLPEPNRPNDQKRSEEGDGGADEGSDVLIEKRFPVLEAEGGSVHAGIDREVARHEGQGEQVDEIGGEDTEELGEDVGPAASRHFLEGRRVVEAGLETLKRCALLGDFV
jgi:hypothetical protein